MTWSDTELEKFGKAEDVHGAEVANALGITLTILDAPSIEDVETPWRCGRRVLSRADFG